MRWAFPVALMAALGSLAGCVQEGPCGSFLGYRSTMLPVVATADGALLLHWEVTLDDACPLEPASARVDLALRKLSDCGEFEAIRAVALTEDGAEHVLHARAPALGEYGAMVHSFRREGIDLPEQAPNEATKLVIRAHARYPSGGEHAKDRECVREIVQNAYAFAGYHRPP